MSDAFKANKNRDNDVFKSGFPFTDQDSRTMREIDKVEERTLYNENP